MTDMEEIKEEFVKTGTVRNPELLRAILSQAEGPEAMLAYRLLRIHEGAPDLNDGETLTLLRRKNQRILDNHFSDARSEASRHAGPK